MRHLARFIIGIRHNRLFRFRDLSGELIDSILKGLPDKFSAVSTEINRTNDGFVLHNTNETLLLRANLDDLVIESKKIFDFPSKQYIESQVQESVRLGIDILPILTESLKIKDDFIRIGIVYEFRIPKWEAFVGSSFGTFITQNFIDFNTPDEANEGSVRFSYKIRAGGGGVVPHFDDFFNVIIRIEESKGLNEEGKEEKCLFVSVDIQHIFKPLLKKVDITGHFGFAEKHLKEYILPALKEKGVQINYD